MSRIRIPWSVVMVSVISLLAGGCAVVATTTEEVSQPAPRSSNAAATTRPVTSGPLPSGVFKWDQIPVVQTSSGQRRAFFDSPTRTLDQLELHVSTLNPGQSPHPPHQHPDEELIMVKEGTLEATVNGHSEIIEAGSAFFAASGDLHGIKNVGQTPATYFVLRWFSPGKKPKAG